ncbi:MAG: Hsp20/alpha crystallin family protein [Betaproteobacteria bacterium]|nr:Hsp20/alpha crystallin family protein [Betaproteobacteria bacterium]
MANVTRFNPFEDSLDDLFRGFFVKPVAFENERPVQIKMDVKEDGNNYVVHAEIPGVQKEDIHVTIDGNQVAISAEVKRQSEEKQGERVLRSERYYGKVQRMFSLASEVDSAGSQARYSDGVLELTLPKKATVSSKRISVQ